MAVIVVLSVNKAMEKITSYRNDKIKRITRLRRQGNRDGENLFGVEGAREIHCALVGGYQPIEIFYSEILSEEARKVLSSLQLIPGTICQAVTPPIFEKIALREKSDGLFVLFRRKAMDFSTLPMKNPVMYLVLEGVEKPGNIGAILRTADCVGVNGVIVTNPKVDVFNPNLIRASLGAIFLLPIVVAEEQQVAAHLKSRSIRVICADPAAKKSHFDVALDKSVAFIFGSEAEGISSFWLRNADERLRIPMNGTVDSLNVSVAAAVLMYEAARQRR